MISEKELREIMVVYGLPSEGNREDLLDKVDLIAELGIPDPSEIEELEAMDGSNEGGSG